MTALCETSGITKVMRIYPFWNMNVCSKLHDNLLTYFCLDQLTDIAFPRATALAWLITPASGGVQVR